MHVVRGSYLNYGYEGAKRLFLCKKQKSRTWIYHMRNLCTTGFTQNSSSALPAHILDASLTKCKQKLLRRSSNASPTLLKQGASPHPSHASLTKTDASLTLLSFRCMEKTPPSDASAMFLRRGDVSVPAQRKLQEMRCTERETLHADRSC